MRIDIMACTTERVTELNDKLWNFLAEELPELSDKYGNTFNYNNAHFEYLVKKNIFLVGKQNGHIRGIMVASLSKSPFDVNVKILQQVLFFSTSNRVTHALFNKFIDIGKNEADHINMTLTDHTNIKPSTLKRYGFKKLETVYRMEV